MQTSTKTQDEVQCRLLLDVVIRKGATIFQLFASKDEALLIRWDAFLVLNFRLNVINRVAGFNVQGDRFASQGLHEDLHTTAKAKHQVQCRLLLDVVIRKGTTIFQLFAGKDEALLI